MNLAVVKADMKQKQVRDKTMILMSFNDLN